MIDLAGLTFEKHYHLVNTAAPSFDVLGLINSVVFVLRPSPLIVIFY